MALPQAFVYTVVTIKERRVPTMADQKNLCALIPMDLHDRVSRAKAQVGTESLEDR